MSHVIWSLPTGPDRGHSAVAVPPPGFLDCILHAQVAVTRMLNEKKKSKLLKEAKTRGIKVLLGFEPRLAE